MFLVYINPFAAFLILNQQGFMCIFLPAKVFGLQNRGQIREGNYADLVIIDFDSIKDLATYDFPKQYPLGIETIIINGQLVLNANKIENNNAGKILKPKK